MNGADRADEASNTLKAAEIEAIQKKLAPNPQIECEDCTRDIPADRKAAVPSATRCIDCEEFINFN